MSEGTPVSPRAVDTPAPTLPSPRTGALTRWQRVTQGRASAEIMLVVTVLLWSGSFTASRFAVTNGFHPLQYASLRWLLGALILVSIVLWREGSIRIDRRDLRYLAPAVLLGVLINQISFNFSIELATASTVALVFGTLPIFAAVITRVLGWEQLKRWHWIATGVSFGGVALVALGAGGQLSGELGGILLALVASATFAAYSVAVGPLMHRYSAVRVSALVAIAGAIPLTLIAIPQLARADWDGLSVPAWGALAYVIFMFVTTTILWFTAIDRVGAAHATLWSNLQPFIAAVLAVLILSESIGPLQVLGGAAIALSIVIARWRWRGHGTSAGELHTPGRV